MPAAAAQLLSWPRERERVPFDVAVWNRFMNFMNGNVYARAIWVGNHTVFLLSLDNAGVGGKHLDAGGVLQVSDVSGVHVLSGSLRLANNVWLLAVDFAGTGTVNLLRLNTSDEIEIGVATKPMILQSPMKNNTGLSGRNSTGTAVSLLRYNASNVIEHGAANTQMRFLSALVNSQPILFRNFGNTADVNAFLLNGSDVLEIGAAGGRIQFMGGMLNATKLTGRNNTNTGTVDLIGLNGSDIIETGVAGTRNNLLGTVVAPQIDPPTVDGQVVNMSQVKGFYTGYVSAGVLSDGANWNVASATRTGAGQISVAWDRDFSNAFYHVQVSIEDSTATVLVPKVTSKNGSGVNVTIKSAAGVATDPECFHVMALGTLV